MSTDLIWRTDTDSLEQTLKLAEKIASNLKGGEVIELVSDLGGGKTTFTRGLAKGMGSKAHVSSPTFKISNIYKGNQLTMYHYDFYRLNNDELIAHELDEALDDKNGVIVVEWADRLKGVLPSERMTINIKSTGEESRQFTLSYPKQLKYVLEGIR